MKRKSKVEGMRKWREEQEEKKKLSKSVLRKKQSRVNAESCGKLKQKAVATKTRTQCRKTRKGRNGKSTARVRKFHQKEEETDEKQSPKQRKVEEIPG